MTRSCWGLGSECNKCLVWEHMIVDLLLLLYLAEALSSMPILRFPRPRWRAQSPLLMHWRETALSANDAPKSRSSRPGHVVLSAEGAALHGLVNSPLLSIFGGERLVDTPRNVSLELAQVVVGRCTLPSAQSII